MYIIQKIDTAKENSSIVQTQCTLETVVQVICVDTVLFWQSFLFSLTVFSYSFYFYMTHISGFSPMKVEPITQNDNIFCVCINGSDHLEDMCRNMVWGFGLISPGLGCGSVACEHSKEFQVP